MRVQDQDRRRKTFTMGVFQVTEYPYHFADLYTLYEIRYRGELVRKQISYPTETDGRNGLSLLTDTNQS